MFRPHLYGPPAVLATMVGVGMLVVSWTKRWGATAAEVAWQLPCDSIVPHPLIVTTRAITIDAPASAIWPWLTRLIERSRTAVAGDTATILGRLISAAPAADLLAIGDFVMARKHLRGIKQRAESTDGGGYGSK